MNPKPEDVTGYSSVANELVEQVLLEVWTRLGDFHSHLVLVGGLAPRYIVDQGRVRRRAIPPHCGTMDVDLAVSLAAPDIQAYASIRETLIERLGFRPGTNPRGAAQRHSFVKNVGRASVILDFLTVKYGGPPEVVRRVQKDLSAIQVDGLGLALKDPLRIPVHGELLVDGRVETTLRVCRPIPFVVLKALALEKRGERKDAYDLVYILRYAADNPQSLARSVTDEERKAASFRRALDALRLKFESPQHDGPTKYERFVGGSEPDAARQAFASVQEFLQETGLT